MKIKGIVLMIVVVITVITLRKLNANEKKSTEEIPKIEASFEVVHPVGHINQFETETENDLKLEEWMSCDSTWTVNQ